MQDDSQLRTTQEVFKPRPWLLRTFLIGMATGFVLAIVGTVIFVICMSVYNNSNPMEVFTSDKFISYLPGIGLVGPLFSVFALLTVAITKLLELIRPPDDS